MIVFVDSHVPGYSHRTPYFYITILYLNIGMQIHVLKTVCPLPKLLNKRFVGMLPLLSRKRSPFRSVLLGQARQRSASESASHFCFILSTGSIIHSVFITPLCFDDRLSSASSIVATSKLPVVPERGRCSSSPPPLETLSFLRDII